MKIHLIFSSGFREVMDNCLLIRLNAITIRQVVRPIRSGIKKTHPGFVYLNYLCSLSH